MNKFKIVSLAAGTMLALAFTSCSSDEGEEGGYKTVQIGEQVWFAENSNEDVEGSRCYDDDPDNCKKYGRLYDWDAAMKACPEGFHLPSQEEWEVMTAYIGGIDTEGKKLKAKSGWNGNGNGTDDYSFSALPGGEGSGIRSYSKGSRGYWWTATKDGNYGAYSLRIFSDYDGAEWNNNSVYNLYSVRCVKD